MSDRPDVVVGGEGDRVEALLSALARRGLSAARATPRTVGRHLETDPPDCVVCLGGGGLSALETLAAVRERGPGLRTVVVDPEVDVTGRASRVVGTADPDAVAGAVDELLQPPGADGHRDGGGLIETGPHGEQFRRLLGATRELLAAGDVETVCEVAVEAAQDIVGLPAVGIHLHTGDATPTPGQPGSERLPPVVTSRGARELFRGDPPTYTPEDTIVWDVYERGEHAAIDDLGATDRDSPARSVLVLPLGAHGVLISSSPQPGGFGDAETDLGKLLAANTEAALDDVEHRDALRKRERELRAERDRLSALFENVPVPAAHIDHRDGEPIVLAVNGAFEDVFGYDADEVVGENIDDYVIPENAPREPRSVADEAAGGGAITRQVQRRTADGLREFLLTIAPVEPGERDGLAYGFYIDVTDRQRRQQRLRVLSRVLRHDLRNQVTLIRGTAEQVAERATEPDLERSATDIADAAGELASLGRKTRVVERTLVEGDAGEASTLGRIVEGVVAPFRAGSWNARVSVHVPRDAAVPSAEAVALALHELVENAIVHNDAAEPRAWVHGWTTDDGFLVVQVADDGPGIPDEERAVLAGERTPTQLEHASGLGLWMARWVAGALGGEFAIQSSDADGTVVELRVPLAST